MSERKRGIGVLVAIAMAASGACATSRGSAAGAAASASSAASAAMAAAAPSATQQPVAWMRSATLYEVNVRQYTPEGTFAAFERHLPRLRALGVDVLWLMPVQPIGKKNRKGGLGSYYSVADYKGVNPEFGTAADFRHLADAAHAQGFHVVLDWVPNHTAFDNAWITAHPDWYSHRADGSISYAHDNEDRETDWTDVAELNYGNRAMRAAMIDAMRFWLDSMHVDGFRCDVAGGVPDDFWREARAALQADRPDIWMLAEAEGAKYWPSFDATYGWEFHHLLNEIAKGKQPTSAIDAYLARERAAYPPAAMRMYFTSNHDENSWNGSEFERMGANHIPAFVLAATMERSLPLLYTGQEASMQKRLRFFEKDTVDWSGTSLADFYRGIFDLKHRNPALWNGAAGAPMTVLATDGGPRVYAFSRVQGADAVVTVVNFGEAAVTVHYSGLSVPGRYVGWFNRDTLSLGASGIVAVPPHSFRLLTTGSTQ